MIESSLMINYGLQKREKENHFFQLKLTNKEENLVFDILTFGRFCHGHKDLLTTDMCKSYQKYIKLTISASYFFLVLWIWWVYVQTLVFFVTKKTWKK